MINRVKLHLMKETILEKTEEIQRERSDDLGEHSAELKEIVGGIQHWRIWLSLGWQDIRLRYRRSVLGPFWITLSMAATVYTLGMVYAFLFKTNIAEYFPHIATGILLWTFFMTTIVEMVDCFLEANHMIKQLNLPFLIYVLRILTRNAIIFFHNFLAIIPILILFKTHMMPLLFLFNTLLCMSCIACFGMNLAILGARFRDIKPIVQSLLQFVFYLTPIMWLPSMLPAKYTFVYQFNPFYAFLEMVRAPLLGRVPSLSVTVMFFTLFIAGGALLLYLIKRSRKKIAFWV